MIFELDKQTIKDLEIFGDGKSNNSIFNFYNQTKTTGGRDSLFHLMENPLNEIQELKKRVELISFLASIRFELKINSSQFDYIEHYIGLNIPTLRNNIIDAFLQNLTYQLKPRNDYYLIQSGMLQIKYLFIHLKEKLAILDEYDLPESLKELTRIIKNFIEDDDFSDFNKKGNKISFSNLNRLVYRS